MNVVKEPPMPEVTVFTFHCPNCRATLEASPQECTMIAYSLLERDNRQIACVAVGCFFCSSVMKKFVLSDSECSDLLVFIPMNQRVFLNKNDEVVSLNQYLNEAMSISSIFMKRCVFLLTRERSFEDGMYK